MNTVDRRQRLRIDCDVLVCGGGAAGVAVATLANADTLAGRKFRERLQRDGARFVAPVPA